MRTTFTGSQTSITLRGLPIPGAEDRQGKIAGFDQSVFSASRVIQIGAGGLASFIAPTLARKGIGALTLIDDDFVDPSNLNRQRFYSGNIGQNKAIALARNLHGECIAGTEVRGIPLRFEDAMATGVDLSCDVAICGVDNNPARVAASRYFRERDIPLVVTGVSANGDHGYVFIQNRTGPCLGCLFPDIVNDDRFPCPGTPAIADILQAVGALAVYAVDTLLMKRTRNWNYRRISLSDTDSTGGSTIVARNSCKLHPHA